jgi:hypothetical protein
VFAQQSDVTQFARGLHQMLQEFGLLIAAGLVYSRARDGIAVRGGIAGIARLVSQIGQPSQYLRRAPQQQGQGARRQGGQHQTCAPGHAVGRGQRQLRQRPEPDDQPHDGCQGEQRRADAHGRGRQRPGVQLTTFVLLLSELCHGRPPYRLPIISAGRALGYTALRSASESTLRVDLRAFTRMTRRT